MKKILTTLLMFCAQLIMGQPIVTNLATGQSITFVQFRNAACTNISIQVASNQILEIEGFSTAYYGSISIVDTNYNTQNIFIAGNNATMPSSNYPAPLKFAGPLTVNFNWIGGQSAGFPAWATCKVSGNGSSSAQDVSSQSIPSTAVAIPADAAGPVQIVLESSQDLINWVSALPGSYGTSTTNRFFRVRAIR